MSENSSTGKEEQEVPTTETTEAEEQVVDTNADDFYGATRTVDTGTGEREITEISSLCINCEKFGLTRLLPVSIPYYKDVIVMSFECPHCSWTNKEIQSASGPSPTGVKFNLKCVGEQDLKRQIVRSETATIKIPELDFEIPARASNGVLTTVQGLFVKAIEGLTTTIETSREKTDPVIINKLEEFVAKLQDYSDGKVFPFTILLDDAAGNSFIQNFNAPKIDPNLTITQYKRTAEQSLALGYEEEDKETKFGAPVQLTQDQVDKIVEENADLHKEAVCLPATCSHCKNDGEVRSVIVDIPHFKEVILMAFSCDFCGYKSNEVKTGGKIGAKGTIIALKVKDYPIDLNRDILKSDTAGVGIPELNFEISPGTLGGKFTTIEGLLTSARDQLLKTPFITGDSADNPEKQKMSQFLSDLSDLLEGKREFTLIMNDPLGNSYIQNIYAPDPDPNLIIEEYERTEEQNEALGLNEMKTENYSLSVPPDTNNNNNNNNNSYDSTKPNNNNSNNDEENNEENDEDDE